MADKSAVQLAGLRVGRLIDERDGTYGWRRDYLEELKYLREWHNWYVIGRLGDNPAWEIRDRYDGTLLYDHIDWEHDKGEGNG